MNVGRVGVHPEVVAVGVAIEMEPQPVTTNLDDDRDGGEDEGYDDDAMKGYARTFNKPRNAMLAKIRNATL